MVRVVSEEKGMVWQAEEKLNQKRRNWTSY